MPSEFSADIPGYPETDPGPLREKIAPDPITRAASFFRTQPNPAQVQVGLRVAASKDARENNGELHQKTAQRGRWAHARDRGRR